MSDEGSSTPRAPRGRKFLLPGFGLACAAGMFVLMANQGQVRHGALYGSVLLLGALLGLFSALGIASQAEATPLVQTAFYPRAGEPRWAAPRSTVPAALLLLLLVPLLFGLGALPVALVLSLLTLLVSSLRRPALFVFVASALLYLPMLGVYGLWDPWETHYGEVSREILSRDDWISLWWAQDKWFWSKPILIFWSEALTWSASGLPFGPDRHPAHTEWVLRLPIWGMATLGLLAVYAVIARVFRLRTGVVAALVLATTPFYATLSHQAITDMPFVANMTVAVMLLTLALVEDPERRVKAVRVGPFAFSLQHAVIALVVAIGLPQVLYLASRNVTFVSGLFAWHRDSFVFGSAGNPDVPGNFGIRSELPRVRGLAFEPLGQALFWLVGLCGLLFLLRRERRAQSLYMFAFYVFCALAFMAKGIPGFALPGLCALLSLLATGRFSMLFSGQLRIGAGIATVAVLGLPWFVAMFVRHGPAFTDRLLVHDHINRLTSGVHGDNGSIQYFIWQLGYGLFPWVALAPAALGAWLLPASFAADDEVSRKRRDVLYVLGLWFAASFTLFSAMTTKFHHYIFPAVPPAAVLIGILLDRLMDRERGELSKQRIASILAALGAPVLLILGVAGLRGNVRGVVPDGVEDAARAHYVLQHGLPVPLALAFVLLAAGLFVLSLRTERSAGGNDLGSASARAALAVALLSGALLAAFIGRDLSWHLTEGPPGSTRLIHLFVYNYGRPWPPHFDYRPMFTGFSVALVGLVALCALPRLRRTAALSLLGLGLAFTVWTLDVYLIDLSPHWSQRELVKRYYDERKDASEPLVAWQMNWKGENYYTGNRVAVFVDLDNKKVLEWIKKNEGKRAYFILEHTRFERFKRMVAPREAHALTTMRDCNKFLLVRLDL